MVLPFGNVGFLNTLALLGDYSMMFLFDNRLTLFWNLFVFSWINEVIAINLHWFGLLSKSNDVSKQWKVYTCYRLCFDGDTNYRIHIFRESVYLTFCSWTLEIWQFHNSVKEQGNDICSFTIHDYSFRIFRHVSIGIMLCSDIHRPGFFIACSYLSGRCQSLKRLERVIDTVFHAFSFFN